MVLDNAPQNRGVVQAAHLPGLWNGDGLSRRYLENSPEGLTHLPRKTEDRRPKGGATRGSAVPRQLDTALPGAGGLARPKDITIRQEAANG